MSTIAIDNIEISDTTIEVFSGTGSRDIGIIVDGITSDIKQLDAICRKPSHVFIKSDFTDRHDISRCVITKYTIKDNSVYIELNSD